MSSKASTPSALGQGLAWVVHRDPFVKAGLAAFLLASVLLPLVNPTTRQLLNLFLSIFFIGLTLGALLYQLGSLGDRQE